MIKLKVNYINRRRRKKRETNMHIILISVGITDASLIRKLKKKEKESTQLINKTDEKATKKFIIKI